MLKIQIKYCGGCNPEIDRGRVVEQLFTLLKKMNSEAGSAGEAESPDLVLVVNGCAHACKEEELRKTAMPFPIVSVQGKRIDLTQIPENQLPFVLLDKILGFIVAISY